MEMKHLNAAAQDVFLERGFSEEAVAALQSRFLADVSLTAAAIRFASYETLLAAQRDARAAISRATNCPAPKTYTKEFQERLTERIGRYYRWPLMSGLSLADATRDDLLADAQRFQKNADGNARNALFLRSVSRRLQEGQKVRDVLTEEQLASIMERARRKVEAAV